MNTSLVRQPFFSELDQMLSDFNRFAQPSVARNIHTALNFKVNSEENAAVAEIEVPGVEPSDVKVRIEGRSLSVETPRGNAYITIGQRLSPDEATASLKHGLLTIRVPKKDARIVEVQVHEA